MRLSERFDASGHLLQSTLLGGSIYDRAYGVKVDRQGYIYVPDAPERAFQSQGELSKVILPTPAGKTLVCMGSKMALLPNFHQMVPG